MVEEVQVVSASRQEELRQSLNTNVSVISRRHIEESGSQTVGELLREVPGVLSRRGSETAGAAGEQIQGIDSRQVLVLLDGQPLLGARGIKRGVVNLDRQSSARLEQVEVVKGAASALYGSDAIGGVINLITRDATAPFDTTGELSGGSRGEVNAVAEAGMRRSRLSGLFSIEHHRNDGFDLTPTTVDTTGAPFERVDFMGRARVKAGETLSLSVLATGYDNVTGGRSNRRAWRAGRRHRRDHLERQRSGRLAASGGHGDPGASLCGALQRGFDRTPDAVVDAARPGRARRRPAQGRRLVLADPRHRTSNCRAAPNTGATNTPASTACATTPASAPASAPRGCSTG